MLLVSNSSLITTMEEIGKKIPDYSKCITTLEINKLTLEIFASRLKQTNLASKNDVVPFVKQADFDNKLKNMNKIFTLI